MARENVRIHVLLPKDVVAEIDEIVGKRHRSGFILEAVEHKLRNARQRKALAEGAGALADYDLPDWETPEKSSQWVHDMRRADDAHRMRKAWGERDDIPVEDVDVVASP